MIKDLIIKSENLAITLNAIVEILKAEGKNQGGCGFLSDGNGVFHLLLQDTDSARPILESTKLTVSEERDVFVIIADGGNNISRKLNGVTEVAQNFYVLKVPGDGSVKVSTHIDTNDDNNQDAPGCSHIIFDILHNLGLTK